MTLLLLLLGAAPHKHRLAQAVEAFLAGDQGAVRAFEELHEQRPWDDDVALWLARARLVGQRCEEAQALLLGRSGRAWPEGTLRAYEGLAAACLRDDERAVELLEEARASLPAREPSRQLASAALGLLLAEQGQDQDAALALIEAGGTADVLEPWLVDRLGGPRLGLTQASVERSYLVRTQHRWWLADPSGLAAPIEPPEISSTEPCGGSSYALGPEGLLSEGRVLQHPRAGLGELDLACVNGEILVLRMGPDGSLVESLEGEAVDLQELLVLAIDGSGEDLLLVALQGDQRQLWWRHGDQALAPLLSTPLSIEDARWPG